MRDLYVMELPHRIILGKGLVNRLEDEVKGWGFQKPVYIVGDYTERFVRNGNKIKVRKPKKELLDEIDIEDADILVGIGGGKNLDAAKYLSMKYNIPYSLVPTLPSSDGIASPAISLITETGRVSLIHRPPLFILLDFDILASVPTRYVLAGYGDVVAKYSSVYDWWLGHLRTGEYFGYLTSRLMKFAFRHVVSNRGRLHTPEGIHILLESLILCGGGIGIQRSSRPASGSEHLISHALDIIHIRNGENPGLHGLQVGMNTIFTSYLQKRNWRYIKRILMEVGHPTRLEDLGIDTDIYVEAVLMAPTLRKRHTILNEVHLTRKRIVEILEEVGMI